MSSFWSWWIIILTVVSFIAVTWLLFANRTGAPADPEQTTGHAADGIEEYDNPMPYWWFLMFVITLVFGAGYLVVYPGLGNFPGLLGWTQLDQWERSVEAAEERYSAVRSRYLAMPIEHHPAFYGCFDWHSAVHGHWSLVYLMKTFPGLARRDDAIRMLDENLTAENIEREIAYFSMNRDSASFERTYGWAWLLKLQEELLSWDDEKAANWALNLQPLADHISQA